MKKYVQQAAEEKLERELIEGYKNEAELNLSLSRLSVESDYETIYGKNQDKGDV